MYTIMLLGPVRKGDTSQSCDQDITEDFKNSSILYRCHIIGCAELSLSIIHINCSTHDIPRSIGRAESGGGADAHSPPHSPTLQSRV